MKSDSNAAAAAPRILFVEDGEPIDGEPIDGEPIDGEPIDGEPIGGEPIDDEPAGDSPDVPPEDRDAQGLPRPLLIEPW